MAFSGVSIKAQEWRHSQVNGYLDINLRISVDYYNSKSYTVSIIWCDQLALMWKCVSILPNEPDYHETPQKYLPSVFLKSIIFSLGSQNFPTSYPRTSCPTSCPNAPNAQWFSYWLYQPSNLKLPWLAFAILKSCMTSNGIIFTW